jgi:predicted ArsR family transcriptional regulator
MGVAGGIFPDSIGVNMKTTVSLHDFRDAFRRIRPNNFSYEGLGVLFEYLEDLETDSGNEIELDVIAICCDFCENNWEDIANEYGFDLEGIEDEDEKIETVKRYLSEDGVLIGEVPGGFVYRDY